ncbi:MAG: tetratricopeptide repeat protein [Chloroflexi bacterium]|nr:tetratricopeptide repeat protein [Chloroflexota bacterium]MCL5111218.1 tetratricopeptide repeat protein [Chloroflexota bacterium]
MVEERTGEEQIGNAARTSMLRMARSWQTAGQINQAVDTYSRILARYPGSPEARAAADEILALARGYEREGRYRLALSLHDRLEQLV